MWLVNNKNEIRMTKGDTPCISLCLYVETPNRKRLPYTPVDGDQIIFALSGDGVSLVKHIPIDTMVLCFDESDTADLPEGEYVYEISLNTAGYHCTFIPSTRFIIMHEIYDVRSNDSLSGTIVAHSAIQGYLSQPGIPGPSAYDIAVKNGYTGTEEEWLESFIPSWNLVNTKITAPETAAVGQILCVKEVDADGKPVSWETVDRTAILG